MRVKKSVNGSRKVIVKDHSIDPSAYIVVLRDEDKDVPCVDRIVCDTQREAEMVFNSKRKEFL